MDMSSISRSITVPPPTTATGYPRLCFVGPLLGVNPGWVTSQGEIVAGLLADEG